MPKVPKIKTSDKTIFFIPKLKAVSKIVDYVQGQGIPRIESGAYTLVREHFNSRVNAAIGR